MLLLILWALFHVPGMQISGVGILWIAYFIDRKLYKWSEFVDSELTSLPQVLTAVGLTLLVIAVVCVYATLKNIKYRLILVGISVIYPVT